MNTMTITSAQYVNDRSTGQPSCIKANIDGTEFSVPLASGNRHYDEIMRQVAARELQILPADAPAAPTLEHVKADAVGAMVAWIDEFLSQFTNGVPAAEVASWPVKVARAREHLAGSPQPMILAEAKITGENPDALARKIVEKANAFEAICAKTTGLRRITEAAIAKAETPQGVASALQEARAKAEAMAQAMGISLLPS